VEIVDKFEIFNVREDEISHGASFRLRKRSWASKSFRAGIISRSKVSVREAIVAIEIDSSVGVISAEPLASPRVISVFAFHNVIGSLEESLLNVENAVNVDHGNEVKGRFFEQIDVMFVAMDHTVQKLVNNEEWHLD